MEEGEKSELKDVGCVGGERGMGLEEGFGVDVGEDAFAEGMGFVIEDGDHVFGSGRYMSLISNYPKPHTSRLINTIPPKEKILRGNGNATTYPS